MKWTLAQNISTQILGGIATLSGLIIQSGYFVPAPGKIGGMIALAGIIAQGTSAIISNFKNPDGRPASEPYRKIKKSG